MNIIKVLLLIFIFMLVTLAIQQYDVLAQATYLPVGPQTNVPEAVVTRGGWTECYRDTYNIALDTDAHTVLSDCTGDLLMLACRPTGSDTLTLLAQGLRSDVTFDTGINFDVLHIANGVGWYFADTWSWGFVKAGDSVEKDECDTDDSGANDDRLCWHLTGGGGYRCGATQDLNDSTEYERIVYTANAGPVLRPIPTLSEWGLMAMTAILGIAGFIAIRRRKVTA